MLCRLPSRASANRDSRNISLPPIESHVHGRELRGIGKRTVCGGIAGVVILRVQARTKWKAELPATSDWFFCPMSRGNREIFPWEWLSTRSGRLGGTDSKPLFAKNLQYASFKVPESKLSRLDSQPGPPAAGAWGEWRGRVLFKSSAPAARPAPSMPTLA